MYSIGVCYVLFRWDMVKTVLITGCFGVQCSVEPARGQQFKERVSCKGSRVNFLVKSSIGYNVLQH